MFILIILLSSLLLLLSSGVWRRRNTNHLFWDTSIRTPGILHYTHLLIIMIHTWTPLPSSLPNLYLSLPYICSSVGIVPMFMLFSPLWCYLGSWVTKCFTCFSTHCVFVTEYQLKIGKQQEIQLSLRWLMNRVIFYVNSWNNWDQLWRFFIVCNVSNTPERRCLHPAEDTLQPVTLAHQPIQWPPLRSATPIYPSPIDITVHHPNAMAS